jgi:hypothetical protein
MGDAGLAGEIFVIPTEGKNLVSASISGDASDSRFLNG